MEQEQEPVETADAPIANPLTWARALRANAVEPRGHEYDCVLAWLYHQRWRCIARIIFQDPFDLVRSTLGFAVHAQATREAQYLLGPMGYELSGGARMGSSAWWAPGVFEVRKPRGGHCSLGQALKLEGLYTAHPPALPVLVKQPALCLVYGGLSA